MNTVHMDQYIKFENHQLNRPVRVRRNGAIIKSTLATFVIICYIYTCVHIIYFIYYIIYKLLQN